jgi:hypothetical protein
MNEVNLPPGAGIDIATRKKLKLLRLAAGGQENFDINRAYGIYDHLVGRDVCTDCWCITHGLPHVCIVPTRGKNRPKPEEDGSWPAAHSHTISL